jgi:hypothetical protein
MNDYLPFQMVLSDPIKAISKAGLLALLGLILGLILPGLSHFELGTFSHDDVIKHLDGKVARWSAAQASRPDNLKLKDALASVKEFNDETDLLKKNIAILDRQIAEDAPTSNLNETAQLLNIRRDLKAYLDGRKPAFYIRGFYPEPSTMFLWSIFYVSFFWLLFIFAPHVKIEQSLTSHVLMFFGLLILFRWPTWLRNTELGNIGRTVYTPANFDISAAGFIVQEANSALVVWCMLELFLVWFSYLILWRKEAAALHSPRILGIDQMYFLVRVLSRQFIHWQICSLLLAIAFLPYTFLFWKYVIDFGDHRYTAHALITHALWGACWISISLPLAQTWYEWTVKQAISSYQVRDLDGLPQKAHVEKFPESPIALWNAVTSLAIAGLTFGLPVIKALHQGNVGKE